MTASALHVEQIAPNFEYKQILFAAWALLCFASQSPNVNKHQQTLATSVTLQLARHRANITSSRLDLMTQRSTSDVADTVYVSRSARIKQGAIFTHVTLTLLCAGGLKIKTPKA